MRFALRNKLKIKETYGQKMLDRITLSLKEESDRDNHDIHLLDGDKYKTIFISDAGHSINIIAFYILGTHYDVYKLAFKEFIG